MSFLEKLFVPLINRVIMAAVLCRSLVVGVQYIYTAKFCSLANYINKPITKLTI